MYLDQMYYTCLLKAVLGLPCPLALFIAMKLILFQTHISIMKPMGADLYVVIFPISFEFCGQVRIASVHFLYC